MWDVGPKEAPSIEPGRPGRGEADGPRLAQQHPGWSWVLTQGQGRTRGRSGLAETDAEPLEHPTRTRHDDALDSPLLRNGG